MLMSATVPDMDRNCNVESGFRFDSNHVRLARLRAGLTQEGLARKLDVTSRTVARWEGGTAIPSGENLLRIAGLLGVSTSDLWIAA